MKRTELKRRTPLRAKAPPPRPVKTIEYQPRSRAVAVAVADTRARMVVPVPKDNPIEHESYRRLVAARKVHHEQLELRQHVRSVLARGGSRLQLGQQRAGGLHPPRRTGE